MSGVYTAYVPHQLDRGHGNPSVPMDGVPQIPKAADELFKHGYEDLPPKVEELCDAAIADAMAEHRRRREALKLGMDLSRYWPKDRDDDGDAEDED